MSIQKMDQQIFDYKEINLINPPFTTRKPRKKLYPKARRNKLCPCGSGKKFKKCCIDKLIDIERDS